MYCVDPSNTTLSFATINTFLCTLNPECFQPLILATVSGVILPCLRSSLHTPRSHNFKNASTAISGSGMNSPSGKCDFRGIRYNHALGEQNHHSPRSRHTPMRGLLCRSRHRHQPVYSGRRGRRQPRITGVAESETRMHDTPPRKRSPEKTLLQPVQNLEAVENGRHLTTEHSEHTERNQEIKKSSINSD